MKATGCGITSSKISLNGSTNLVGKIDVLGSKCL